MCLDREQMFPEPELLLHPNGFGSLRMMRRGAVCQGEACSIAAAALVFAQGESDGRIEHAAGIAMDHNLASPMIRSADWRRYPAWNAMPQARRSPIDASRIATQETAGRKLPVDQVIRTITRRPGHAVAAIKR